MQHGCIHDRSSLLRRSRDATGIGVSRAAAPPLRISLSRVLAPCNFPIFLLFATQLIGWCNSIVSGELNPPEWESQTHIKYLLTASLTLAVAWRFAGVSVCHIAYLGGLSAVFVWNIYFNTYCMEASLTALARYLVPMLFLFYGLLYRHRLDNLASGILALTALNNIAQIVVYVSIALQLNFVPVQFMYGMLPRAMGMAGICGYSLMNFTCAVLSYYCLPERNRLSYFYFFVAFGLAAFSIKSLPAYGVLVVFTLQFKRRAVLARILAVVLCVAVVGWIEFSTNSLSRAVVDRYYAYGVDTSSARSDSYRVMFESLGKGNLLGEGLGCFGGPASTKYESPKYQEYGFSWGYCEGIATTDTYYPHVFVELGWIGGVLYLGMFFLPFFSESHRGPSRFKAACFLLCFGLFVEAIASFAIQSFDSMAVTMLLFGVYHRGQGAGSAIRSVDVPVLQRTHPLRARSPRFARAARTP